MRKPKKRMLDVADIMFEIHRSLIPKPDPEIIPIVGNRGFFRGLFKLFYGKSLHVFSMSKFEFRKQI